MLALRTRLDSTFHSHFEKVIFSDLRIRAEEEIYEQRCINMVTSPTPRLTDLMLCLRTCLQLINRDRRVVYFLVQLFADFALVVEFSTTHICIQPGRSFRAGPGAFNILAMNDNCIDRNPVAIIKDVRP